MSKNVIVLLSGTPASGKDTITQKMGEINPRFALFKKHKSGLGGKKDGSYIHVDENAFDSLLASNEFIQHHTRYDRRYGVSLLELGKFFDMNIIPVIHVGKYENIASLVKSRNLECYSILLMASRQTTKSRLAFRHPDDKEEQIKRLTAYDEERRELSELYAEGKSIDIDLVVNTDRLSPGQSAAIINDVIFS